MVMSKEQLKFLADLEKENVSVQRGTRELDECQTVFIEWLMKSCLYCEYNNWGRVTLERSRAGLWLSIAKWFVIIPDRIGHVLGNLDLKLSLDRWTIQKWHVCREKQNYTTGCDCCSTHPSRQYGYTWNQRNQMDCSSDSEWWVDCRCISVIDGEESTLFCRTQTWKMVSELEFDSDVD